MPAAFVGSASNGDSASGTVVTCSVTLGANERLLIHTTGIPSTGTEVVSEPSGTLQFFQRIAASVSPVGNIEGLWEVMSSKAGGTFVLTQTTSVASTFRGLDVARYTGLYGDGVFVSNTQASPATTADAVTSSALVTGPVVPGLLIGFCYDTNSAAEIINAGTGFADHGTFPTEGAINDTICRLEDKRVLSNSSVAATFTSGQVGSNCSSFGIFIPEQISTPLIRPRGSKNPKRKGPPQQRQLRPLDSNVPAAANTVALAGVAAAGAVGSVTAAVDKTLTGAQATGAVGNVTPTIAPVLTGAAATGAVGSVGINVVVALTGVVATGTVGNVTATQSGGAVNLTGVAATGAVGNVSAAVDKALTGVAAAGAVGSVTPALDKALTGNAAAGSVGTIGVNVTVALTGVQATGAVGSVTAVSGGTAALTGVAATGQAGSLAGVDVVVALTGVAAVGTVGNVSVGGNTPPGPSGQTGSGGGGHVGASPRNDRLFHDNLEKWIKKALVGDVEPVPVPVAIAVQTSPEAVTAVKRALTIAHLGLPKQGVVARRVDELEAKIQQLLDDDDDAAVATLLL